MSVSMNSSESGLKGFALIRDRNGKPKFDNIYSIPAEI
jgi:hypothetical protein